jgi:hypothetical protein
MMKTRRRRWTATPKQANQGPKGDKIKILDNANLKSLVRNMELGNPLSGRHTLLNPQLTKSEVNLAPNRNLESLYHNLKSLRSS